jgi:hypothetical protein
MPKILDELYECKMCGFAPTNKKNNYERHCRSVKHKQMNKPDLAKQLMDNKLKQMENKTKLKIEQIENTAELRQRQIETELELRQEALEIKEKIKEEETPERVITQTEMIRTSQGIEAFKEKLLKASDDTIQDYCDIINGVYSFQEIFKRDFTIVYEEDKVCVIDKGQTNRGYYINNVLSHEPFYLDDRYNGVASILQCVPSYFKSLKKCMTEEGFKTEYFKLEERDKRELEEWIKEEITWIHSNS